MQKDIRTRSKYYFSDFADGYTVNTILKTWHSRGSLRRRLIVFISLLGPTIIFAVLLGQYSHMNIGIVETLVGEAIACIVWAFLGGQPMILMGLTGPIAIFTGVLYDFAEWGFTGVVHRRRIHLPFFVMYEWVGIWSALLLLLLVATNKAEIVLLMDGIEA